MERGLGMGALGHTMLHKRTSSVLIPCWALVTYQDGAVTCITFSSAAVLHAYMQCTLC